MIGALSLSAWAVSGKAPRTVPTLIGPVPKSMLRCFVSSAADLSGGNVCCRSFRSLFGPGWKTIRLRSRTVGRASLASGLSSFRKGRSFFATGLDAFTSGSVASSAERRSTNVVFAWRMNGGRLAIA